MPSFNSVTLIGNLTREVEAKVLSGGNTVASFGLAVNERYKSKDGELKEETTFVDVKTWGKLAEICGQHLNKGASVLVFGKIRQERWEKDGVKQSKIVVIADKVEFLSGKRDGERGEAPAKPAQPIGGGYGDDQPPFAPCEAEMWA
jgi:single-strand DNA-binding protein